MKPLFSLFTISLFSLTLAASAFAEGNQPVSHSGGSAMAQKVSATSSEKAPALTIAATPVDSSARFQLSKPASEKPARLVVRRSGSGGSAFADVIRERGDS